MIGMRALYQCMCFMVISFCADSMKFIHFFSWREPIILSVAKGYCTLCVLLWFNFFKLSVRGSDSLKELLDRSFKQQFLSRSVEYELEKHKRHWLDIWSFVLLCFLPLYNNHLKAVSNIHMAALSYVIKTCSSLLCDCDNWHPLVARWVDYCYRIYIILDRF